MEIEVKAEGYIGNYNMYWVDWTEHRKCQNNYCIIEFEWLSEIVEGPLAGCIVSGCSQHQQQQRSMIQVSLRVAIVVAIVLIQHPALLLPRTAVVMKPPVPCSTVASQ